MYLVVSAWRVKSCHLFVRNGLMVFEKEKDTFSMIPRIIYLHCCHIHVTAPQIENMCNGILSVVAYHIKVRLSLCFRTPNFTIYRLFTRRHYSLQGNFTPHIILIILERRDSWINLIFKNHEQPKKKLHNFVRYMKEIPSHSGSFCKGKL